ncbi:hypothetical protein Bbelb_117300 [Branchiostoma belcheri]|nr:hypothetical protein Bbelb_117300 [Branchiostoma belcheri]
MSEEQQRSEADDTGVTRTRRPESYCRSRADAAARIPNPMYASNPPMDQPQTDYQERADDDVTPDVTYASIPDSVGSQSDDRCKTTNPGSSETTEDIPRVGIKNPGQSKVSAMLKTMKTMMSVTNIVLSCCLLGAVIYLGHKIVDMSRVRTRDLWGVSRTRYRLRHTTSLDCAGLSEFEIKSAIRKIDDVAASVAQLKHLVLEKERKTSEHLKKIEATCPLGYKKYREVCYKAIDAEKTFSESDKACRFDGGTLAMPRDAGTNAFLISLKNKMDETDGFWFGLNEKRYEGEWEWVDGTPLGTGYNFLREGPYYFNDDCAMYMRGKDTWINMECREKASFICQYLLTERVRCTQSTMGKLSMILLPVLVIAAAARAPAQQERSKTWSQPGDILPDWSMARLRYDGCSADSAGRAGTFKDLVTTGRHSPRLVNGTTSLRRLQVRYPFTPGWSEESRVKCTTSGRMFRRVPGMTRNRTRVSRFTIDCSNHYTTCTRHKLWFGLRNHPLYEPVRTGCTYPYRLYVPAGVSNACIPDTVTWQSLRDQTLQPPPTRCEKHALPCRTPQESPHQRPGSPVPGRPQRPGPAGAPRCIDVLGEVTALMELPLRSHGAV